MHLSRNGLVSLALAMLLMVGCSESSRANVDESDGRDKEAKEKQAEADKHYHALGQAMVSSELLRQHLMALETREEFKPAVKSLCDEFVTDQFESGMYLPTANDPKEDHKPSSDFERDLLKRWETNEQPDDFSLAKTPKAIWYHQPVYLKTECIHCHRAIYNNSELQENDLVAVIRVRLAAN